MHALCAASLLCLMCMHVTPPINQANKQALGQRIFNPQVKDHGAACGHRPPQSTSWHYTLTVNEADRQSAPSGQQHRRYACPYIKRRFLITAALCQHTRSRQAWSTRSRQA